MSRKIIFIHLLNDYSGSPKVLSQIIKEMTSTSNIELYTSKDDGFLSNITPKHHTFFYKRFGNKMLTLISYTLSQIDLFFKILKFRKDKNTIIYINTILPFGAAIAGKLIGLKVIYHIHETSIKPQIMKNFLRFIVSKTASNIIFVSKDLSEKEFFKEIPSNIIYNAIEEKFLTKALESTYKHFHNNKFIVMMICSLKDYKGIPEFIKIANILKNKSNIKFRLILNAEKEEINIYFKNNKFENIEILSRQKDLNNFYSESSLVLNLSRIDQWVETFGLTIIEALAYGIPVIVPPVGGPKEIVVNNKEGFLISSYDAELISNTIINLSLNEKLCYELSNNAKEKVLEFTENVFLKKIEKVINE